MSTLYGDSIFESKEEYIEEGTFLHSPKAKEIQKNIREICKGLSTKGFKNRAKSSFGGGLQSWADSTKMNSFISQAKKLFSSCNISDGIVKEVTIAVGAVVQTTQYPCRCVTGIVDDILVTAIVVTSKLDFYVYKMYDSELDSSIKPTVEDIFKILNSLHYNPFGVHVKGNTITIKNEYSFSEKFWDTTNGKLLVNASKDMVNKLTEKYGNEYDIKVHKLTKNIVLKKK